MIKLDEVNFKQLENFLPKIVDELIHRAYTDGYENGKAHALKDNEMGASVSNFERMKSLGNEYEMADLIMYILSDNYSEIINKDGALNGLPVLKWLQTEQESN